MVTKIRNISAQSNVYPFQGAMQSTHLRVSSTTIPPVASGDGHFLLAHRLGEVATQQENLSRAAIQVRRTEANLQALDRYLSGMKKNLVELVKMYPPYPMDSPQRVALLNQIQGLRQQVDALVFQVPSRLPFPESAQDPVAAPESTLLKPSDLGLPTLDPGNASDAQIGQALVQVEQAQTTVSQARQGMWHDVVRIVGLNSSAQAESQSKAVRGYLANTDGATLVSHKSETLSAVAG